MFQKGENTCRKRNEQGERIKRLSRIFIMEELVKFATNESNTVTTKKKP